jgi:hypothetical protein
MLSVLIEYPLPMAGHFAALEEPDVLAADLQTFFERYH